MKSCTACRETKPFDAFTKDRGRYIAICRPCRSAKRKAEYAANPEPIKARVNAYRAANPEKVVAYREANRDLVVQRTRDWRTRHPGHDKAYRDANLERERAREAAFREAHPEQCAKRAATRRARKRDAAPAWRDEARIAEVYALAQEAREHGIDCEVDHIIPLVGRRVCGLHVHQNLRVALKANNRSKGNKFEVPDA